MYKNILTKRFFKDNPVKDLTAQQLIYTQIENPKLYSIAAKFFRKYDNEESEQLLKPLSRRKLRTGSSFWLN
ncbi:MAG: hypothetical protein RBT41_12480 [Clostridia bacterium]|nr:hypothetical protein [Clostridia bacterium]